MEDYEQLAVSSDRRSSKSESRSLRVDLSSGIPQLTPPEKVNYKLEQIKKKCIDIFGESTTHAIPNILRRDNVFLKVFWFLLLLVSVGFCSYLIIKAIMDYLNFEVTSKIRLVIESPMTYPMVSICNTSPFITKFAREYFASELVKMINLSDQELAILYGNNSSSKEDRMAFTLRNAQFVYLLQSKVADPNFNKTIQQQFGFNQSELLLNKYFGTFLDPTDYTYSFKDFLYQYYDPNFGNCFRFNSGFKQNGLPIPLLKQHQPGKSHGLYIVAFVDTLENQELFNFMNLDSSFGLKISISNQSYMPFDNMLTLKPGTCTNIAIKKTISKTMPKPYSECVDVSQFDSLMINEFRRLNKTYQQHVCFEMCKHKYFIDKCNCSMALILNYNSYKTCSTIEDYACWFRWPDLLKTVTDKLSRCIQLYCPLECVSSRYTHMNSYEAFPNAGLMSDYAPHGPGGAKSL
jgi:hypothetical protein